MAAVLRLFVALPAEARPLVKAFRLQSRGRSGPFRSYASDSVELWISGIGKIAMAGVVAFAHADTTKTESANALVLNVGIAGHAKLPVGSTFMAERVLDAATGRARFAALALTPPLGLERLITVDRPEREFREVAGYDMEASAFVDMACRFAPAELVHVLKVVSDGSEHSNADLERADVEGLIKRLVPGIERLLELSAELRSVAAAQNAEPEGLAELERRAHFTFSEAQELRRLLKRRAVLAPKAWPEGLDQLTRGRAVNRALATWLETLPLNFGPC